MVLVELQLLQLHTEAVVALVVQMAPTLIQLPLHGAVFMVVAEEAEQAIQLLIAAPWAQSVLSGVLAALVVHRLSLQLMWGHK
jgi:hypothetical protein